MISGASDEELDLANIRADIMLATSVEHLKAVDDFYDKEIERLNNIIDELEKYLKTKLENEISQSYIKGINTALEYIKELKEKE